MPDIVQSLWIGERLSTMERLCIVSFLKAGHRFHLYTYDSVDNVPELTELRDANEIIPKSEIFLNRGGYSSFSDFFRWKLILDKGGWWVDTDAVCLKPLDFKSSHIFVGGLGAPTAGDCVSSGLFKAPKGGRVAQWAWQECQKMNPETMTWGEAGPPLITRVVHNFDLTEQIIPGKLFFPIYYTEAPKDFIRPEAPRISDDCYSVHLFNEMWRLAGQDKDGKYPYNCLYEQLKRRFL